MASKIGISTIIEVEVKKICFEDNKDSGMEMIQITVTETCEIEIWKVKVILAGEIDGMVIEARDTVIVVEGEDGTLIRNIKIRGINKHLHFKNPNHYCPPPIGHQYRYPIPYEQYSYPQQQQYPSQMPPAPSQQAANICQLCQSQGHYDYQCQFAGNFMACTQKAFNQGHSYNHHDPNRGVWSNNDNDNNDPNGQPFQ